MQSVALISAMTVAAAAQTPPRNGTVSGRLLSRNGTPAAETRVVVLATDKTAPRRAVAPAGPPRAAQPEPQPTTTLIGMATTDAMGRYRLENVPAGRYLIAAGPLDVLTFYPGVTNENESTVLTVVNGGMIEGLDFQLRTVRVSGRASGPSGVGLRLGDGPGGPTALVEQDGSFMFRGVTPGTYRFGEGAIGGPLVVGDDDLTGVQVKTGPLMSFPVTVTVEGGGQVPSLRLRFEDGRPTESPVPFIETSGSGVFEVNIPDIQYRLVLPEIPAGFSLKAATLIYPSGGTTSNLDQPFSVHQIAWMTIALRRDGAAPAGPAGQAEPANQALCHSSNVQPITSCMRNPLVGQSR
jgi:hypothetical protein